MKRSLAVLIKASLLLVIAGSLLLAQQLTAAPPSAQQAASEKDHQRMMQLLKITSLRPGADGRNFQSPSAANYEEARANPYPILPALLVLKNGKRVAKAKSWWTQRRPEIVEGFDRETYGRVPKVTPAVKWEVASATNEMSGTVPVITKKLVGHVDNSFFPEITVDIQLTLTTPANAKGPLPVFMEFSFVFPPGVRPPAAPSGAANTTGLSWQQQVLAKGWGYAGLIPTSIQADNGAVNALEVSPTPTVTPTPFPTTPTPTLTQAPTPKPINGLTYFGYWGSSGDGITFDETSAYSNLVWIGDTNISRLSTISQHSGMKAIIYPSNTFFDTNFRLRSDYQIRWNALAAQIKPYVDNKTVIAINPLDEPMWNASQNGISSSDMKSAMESINTSIKQTFPGMTTVIIEAYSMINSSMITPTGYDWIGFDCYGSWDYCNGHSIPEYASIIKSKLSSNQRLILVPDAIYHGLAPSVSDQNQIASRAEQYYQLAVSQAAVAFIPFYYVSFDANYTVAKDMPIVKSKYEELGRRILGLAPTVTPTLTITPTPTTNITPTPTPVSGGPSGYVFCSSENQFCAFSNTRSVAYGANGQFHYLTLTGGTNCSNTVFNDPIYGVAKVCYTKEIIGSTPTPFFPPTPTPTPSVSL